MLFLVHRLLRDYPAPGLLITPVRVQPQARILQVCNPPPLECN